MTSRSEMAALAGTLATLLAAACGPSRPEGGAGDGKAVYQSGVRFRARGDGFEIGDASDSAWRPFFVKGVNLAIATPGRFPGELAASGADYARWLERIGELGCNVVRLYTLHPPAFYQAFGEYNRAHPDRPLYLVQGIWPDELVEGDYVTDRSAQLDEEIALVVDAVHGEASIPERRGKAWGEYRHDVSSFVMAWLPGHELDGYLAQATNVAWSGLTRHDGRYVALGQGLPIEVWIARALDRIVAREIELYGAQRPVGWSNWPALDPVHHPTEPAAYGQDVVDVDLGRLEVRGAFAAGIFVSYHVYPFNPEFICYDPGYATTTGERGEPNSYLGYLLDLKAHHRGVPLLVAEYGVPSSLGVAHVNETSFDHGGYSENEQAEIVVELFRSIVQAGAAGAISFEFMDEWFKQTWLTRETTIPAERGPLWYDVLSPEESFGLVSFYPTTASITVDGDGADWAGRGEVLHAQEAVPVAPLSDGRDAARTLLALRAGADPAYLFLRLDLGGSSEVDFEDVVLFVGISTLPGPTGDRRFPDVEAEIGSGAGLEAIVVVDVRQGIAELRIDEGYDVADRLNGFTPSGGSASPNEDGRYVLTSLVINSARFYVEEDLDFVPEVKWYLPGRLRRGSSTLDTLAHFQLGAGIVELRLPWHALWVTDPSSRMVLDDDPATPELDARATTGFQLFVIAAAHVDGTLRVVDALPRAAFANGRFEDGTPPFLWPGWNAIEVTERVKPVFHALRQAYAGAP